MTTLAWTGVSIFVGLLVVLLYLTCFKRVKRSKDYHHPTTRIVPKAYTKFDRRHPSISNAEARRQAALRGESNEQDGIGLPFSKGYDIPPQSIDLPSSLSDSEPTGLAESSDFGGGNSNGGGGRNE